MDACAWQIITIIGMRQAFAAMNGSGSTDHHSPHRKLGAALELSDPEATSVVLGEQQAWVIETTRASVRGKLTVDIDVRQNTVPVCIVRTDSPQILSHQI